MIPAIALVGRPNVGKSTLFNRLTKSRSALVADEPGLTRDRQIGRAEIGGTRFLVVDTGGLSPNEKSGISAEMSAQAVLAIAESDAVVFVVDSRAGLTPEDQLIANQLRQCGRPVFIAANKSEGISSAVAGIEFHSLGMGEPRAISAAHGDGVRELVSLILEGFPRDIELDVVDEGIRVAVVGRPNVGKSTLINAWLGEERVIAFDLPGTTRDAIDIPFECAGQRYVLIDTAGLRRKGRVFETIEKFSAIKTVQAIEGANVVVMVMDATQEISDQDAHIAGLIAKSGRAMVLAVNKWDLLTAYAKQQALEAIKRRLGFIVFAKVHQISALKGIGLRAVLTSVDQAYRSANSKLSTPRLTRALQVALEKQQPPRVGGVRPKLRYAHQGGRNPPIIVVHGSAAEKVPLAYVRYLERHFTEAFKLSGTPVRVQFKTAANPYASSA